MTLACRELGVSRETVRREKERDEEFLERFNDAKMDAVELAEAELMRRGTVGTPTTKTVRRIGRGGEILEETVTTSTYLSTAGLIAFLRANHPAYKESWRLEHTGADGGPVQVQVERDRTPERLEALLEIAAELGWQPQNLALPVVEHSENGA